MSFVTTLNEILEEKQLSMLSFSKIVDINSSTLYDLNKNHCPSLKNALKIVDYFNSSLDYFENRSEVFEYKYNKNYVISFYPNLILILEQQHISKAKFCRDLCMSQSNFCYWRKGILPKYRNILEIANYLEVSMDELIGRK